MLYFIQFVNLQGRMSNLWKKYLQAQACYIKFMMYEIFNLILYYSKSNIQNSSVKKEELTDSFTRFDRLLRILWIIEYISLSRVFWCVLFYLRSPISYS
jgi:hypothetical protein